MDDATPAIQDQEEDEAVSLSDFPTSNADHDTEPKFTSEPSDLFEFFNDFTHSHKMSHAEDIIFCGKLIPLKENPLYDEYSNRRGEQLKTFNRRRSESLSELKYPTQPNSPKSRYMRSSRSLDYQKLRRSLSFNSESSEIRRNSSAKSCGRYDCSSQKVYKPRWYSLVFGLVAKCPPEMELRDMKSRLVRRNPSTMFPPVDGGGTFRANRSHRKSSWGLLKVLSCKDHASVAVTTSFGCLPHGQRCESAFSRATCT